MSSSTFPIKGFILATVFVSAPLFVYAEEESKKKEKYDTVRVVATKESNVPVNFTSSAQTISQEYLKEKQYTDVGRILTAVPGVNFRNEDGFGLRPNIGIRASRLDRSGDITLLEDGTLIAPAPYAAPAAYYFPDVLRMSEFEVYKGGSSVQYGPRTTSGILNMVTQPIDGKSQVTASLGSFNERIVNAKISQKGENAGFVFTTAQRASDGFRSIEKTNKKAGYEQEDYMLKMSFNTDKDATVYQQFDIKLAAQNHDSDQSYLGLTREDFSINPNRQYAASQMDHIQAKHRQAEIKHTLQVSDFSMATKAYRHTFDRSWYKLDKVNGTNIGDILDDPTTYAAAYNYITGTTNSTGGKLSVKDNARSYVSEGIQVDTSYKIKGYSIGHNVQSGIRLHSDSEDRFQATDKYDITNGRMSLTTAGVYGSSASDNRKGSATAVSLYTKDTITMGDFTIVPGVRYEDITMRDQRWSDSARTTRTTNKKTGTTAFLPSLSGSYLLNEKSAVFVGVHEGFAPPAPSSDADNESSINYELGYRFNSKENKVFFEVASYFNNYKNLLGTDTASSGGAGTGAQYNGGSVHAYGIEMITGKTFEVDAVSFPVTLAYTYTDAQFNSTFTQNGIEEWGNVTKGDRLPYIAKHQFTLNTGVKYNKINFNILSRFVGKSYADAQSINKIPSYMIFDAIAGYKLNKNITTFIAIDNITNRKYLVAYNPDGLRGGKPRTIKIGGTYNF